MAKKNENMHKAKAVQNNEFYTRDVDVAAELKNYVPSNTASREAKKVNPFAGKNVLLNCNDYGREFWRYFLKKKKAANWKTLVATRFADQPDQPSCYHSVDASMVTDKGELTVDDSVTEHILEADPQGYAAGDFRSEACLRLLREADVVVTNPPFSLFREFLAQLIAEDDRRIAEGKGRRLYFLVVGNMNSITYKEVFRLLQTNRAWLGYTQPKEFLQPDATYKKFGNIRWYTNMAVKKRQEILDTGKSYYKDPSKYPKYLNYDAIDCGRIQDMPMDYAGAIGVPITFLDHYNPEQFDLVKFRKGDDNKDLRLATKEPFFRILIRNKMSGGLVFED